MDSENTQITCTSKLKYLEALAIKEESVWQKLNKYTIGEALEIWLSTLCRLTAIAYRSSMNRLAEKGYINPLAPLQTLALVNHEGIIDRIKNDCETWSECTRQAKAACYISFTAFLSRRFQGLIRKALPNKEGVAKTFFKVRDKVKTNAMNVKQWMRFLEELHKINSRDCLMAKIALHGAKRIGEVLSLTTDHIDWEKGEITFLQSKTRNYYKDTIITYPKSVMEELKAYVGDRKGPVFITRTGKNVPLIQLHFTFAKAGVAANMPFRITPHVLRASAITYLKQQGFSDSDIMLVTGHSHAEMVLAYDKSSRAENASKKVNLVC